jgi:hypothetical protein
MVNHVDHVRALQVDIADEVARIADLEIYVAEVQPSCGCAGPRHSALTQIDTMNMDAGAGCHEIESKETKPQPTSTTWPLEGRYWPISPKNRSRSITNRIREYKRTTGSSYDATIRAMSLSFIALILYERASGGDRMGQVFSLALKSRGESPARPSRTPVSVAVRESRTMR